MLLPRMLYGSEVKQSGFLRHGTGKRGAASWHPWIPVEPWEVCTEKVEKEQLPRASVRGISRASGGLSFVITNVRRVCAFFCQHFHDFFTYFFTNFATFSGSVDLAHRLPPLL